MTRILLIPCGGTCWSEQGRLAGSGDMPLSPRGQQQSRDLARGMAGPQAPKVIYSGSGQAAQETAKVIGRSLRLKARVLEGLEEPDIGLWEGLTVQELQQRSPKAYKQLSEEPSKVNPPSGEPLEDARNRLIRCVEQVCQKHADTTVGLVVGPLAQYLLETWVSSPAFQVHWAGRPRPEVEVVGGGGRMLLHADPNGQKSP
jgi:broad specificity phosphatase PhoE